VPLRYRIEAHPETVQDLELASGEKFWEGIELLVTGHRGGGIYLLGYAAEMILKSAYFRFDGARPGDPVGARLGPARSWGKQFLPSIDHENYHSLWFWYHILRRKRRRAGRPLAQALDDQLLRRVRRIYGMWTVAMRYQPDQALEAEAESFYNDVRWIHERRIQLVV